MEVTAARRSSLCDTGSWADRTALHDAAAQGRPLQLRQLIAGGAAVNTVTVDHVTPLHDACIQAHPNCVRMLLEAGAKVDVRTIQGSTPLAHACAAGSLTCVRLLLKRGANVNPGPPGSAPLHEACTRGNVDIVRLLITKGAELEACDTDHTPPLHTACAKGHLDCVLELLNAGANVNSSKSEDTPLHHAARGGDSEAVDMLHLLVEFGGNTQARDGHGHRPADYPAASSPAGACLKAYASTPLSLQQLSRICVRTTLGRRGLKVIGQLDISYIIRGYLQYAAYQTPPPPTDCDGVVK